MRIDLPCCDFEYCKYNSDGNCINENKRNKCAYLHSDTQIERKLLEQIYNQLVCCRRLREKELINYMKEFPENELDYVQIDMFEESIEYTKHLYQELNKVLSNKNLKLGEKTNE